MKKVRRKSVNNGDIYLQSRLQKSISNTTENFELMKFRTGTNYALFCLTNDLKWYLKRIGGMKNANKAIMTNYIETIAKILAPLTPHLCEEMWQMLGNKRFISLESWPKYDANLINDEAELSESMLRQIIDDIEEIKKMTKIKPKKVTLFVAENWKFRVYQAVLRNKDKGINEITKEIMTGDTKLYGNATVLFIQSLYKKLNELKPVVPRIKQMQILNESRKFLENELKCKIEIIDAEKTTNPKAKSSSPQKFGIYLE
jgi:leucyl-tRNA synthetase